MDPLFGQWEKFEMLLEVDFLPPIMLYSWIPFIKMPNITTYPKNNPLISERENFKSFDLLFSVIFNESIAKRATQIINQFSIT